MKDNRYLQFQATLKKKSIGLADVEGYCRLISSINDVADWDGFQAVSAQIDTTSWFKDKGILKEIEPPLLGRAGYADILLSFSHQDIYCEVNSLQSLIKSIEAKRQDTDNEKIKLRLQECPYLTKQDIEHEIMRENSKEFVDKDEEATAYRSPRHPYSRNGKGDGISTGS